MTDKPKKEQITDAAEQLFALNDYHRVSVRDITSAAQARLASVNYYFETKENLYFEVVARRSIIILNERRRRLEAIEFDVLDNHQAIAQICHAIVDPLLEKVMTRDQGWTAFYSVVANLVHRDIDKGEEARKIINYQQSMIDFVSTLQSCSDDNNERNAQYAFQSIVSTSYMIFANNGRINTLSDGKYRSDDYESLYDNGMKFIIGGAIALLASD